MKEISVQLFVHASYYVMWIVLLIFLRSLNGLVNAHGGWRYLLRHKLAMKIAVPALITASVFTTLKPDFRTLSDETNLISVSQNLYSRQQPWLTTSGVYYFDNFHSYQDELPTRPVLYSFLGSLIHSAVGYDYKNLFYLNAFFMMCLLALVFHWVSGVVPTKKRRYGALAAIMVASVPVVAFSSTSAGFDVMAAFFFMLTGFSLQLLFERADDDHWLFFYSCLLLLGYSRYEGVAFAALFFIAAVIGLKIRSLKVADAKVNVRAGVTGVGLSKSYLLGITIATPFLLFLPVAQRIIKRNEGGFDPNVPTFAFEHVPVNIKNLVNTGFDLSMFYPYMSLWNVFIVLSLGLYLGYYLKNRMNSRTESAKGRGDCGQSFIESYGWVVAFLVPVFALNFLYIFYYFGRSEHPSAARFFVLFNVLITMIPFLMLASFQKTTWGRFYEYSLVAIALISVFVYRAVGLENRFINTLTLNRQTREEQRFVKNLTPAERAHVLIVSDRPGQWTAQGYSSISFDYLNRNAKMIKDHVARHLFGPVLLFQRIEYSTQLPVAENQQPFEKTYQVLHEAQITDREYLRVVKVE